MIKRLLLTIGCLAAICSSSAQAVYFPAGIDWANPSQNRFILSMYLNMLGRAPQDRETRNASRFLTPSDTSQTRLDLFKEVLGTREYQRNFGDQDNQWRVFNAPDMNYNNGIGYWRYIASNSQPSGFEAWHLSGTSSESVAESMAHYYDTYCFQGTPCLRDPALAYKRGNSSYAAATPVAHACTDESNLVSQFEWIANNGTTYPRGTDGTTLCMGQHYFKAVGVVLQRYQCESGYQNCQRDESRDIRGQRTGRDSNGNPTLFFADGTRLVLTSHNPISSQTVTDNTIKQAPVLVDSTRSDQHGCANPAIANGKFRWRNSNGSSESNAIGNSTICMDNFYYQIDGLSLKRFDCAARFTDCRANPSKDIAAAKRKRVDGYPGLEFRNGTTLALVKKSTVSSQTSQTTNNTNSTVPVQPAQRRHAGQHECADSTLRVSQFRWTKQNGSSSWPDGVAGRYVCLDDAYYEIQGATLRHHQCSANYQNCSPNRRNDLIAISDSKDGSGNVTLVFANGDQLSLISR